MNRARRRAKVRYHAELILRETGELCASDLTSRLEDSVNYGLDPRTVGQILKSHPRITRICRSGRVTYCLLYTSPSPRD